jgi:hypothetical protein
MIDGVLVALPGQCARGLGVVLEPLRNGLVQFYALSVMLGIGVLLAALLWLKG